jgi:WD40 repeat protein
MDVPTAELIAAGEWDRIAQRLCTLEYVHSKADAGGIFDLIAEYQAAAAAIPSSHPASEILPVIAASLCRNGTFISKHPSAVFQCLWNTCWWHDCADLRDFSGAFQRSPPQHVESSAQGGPVSRLLESWRAENKSAWLRSLLPPATSIEGNLRLEIPLDSDSGLPSALRLSGDQLVAWFRDKSDGKRAEPRVWNSLTGQPVAGIDPDAFPFPEPSMSSDKKLKATWGGDEGGWGHAVRVSDASTGVMIAAFPTDEDHNVSAAAFSPDGKLVAAGATGIGFGGYVYIWDLESKSLRTMLEPRWSVESLAFSPTGDEILAGCSHGELEIWKVANGAIRSSFSGHDSWIVSTAFSSDGERFVSSSYDGTIRVWDRAAEPPARRFAPHPDRIAEARFSPDGHRLVTGRQIARLGFGTAIPVSPSSACTRVPMSCRWAAIPGFASTSEIT